MLQKSKVGCLSSVRLQAPYHPDQIATLLRSISTVYRGVCSATHVHVIIKAYEKAKMKPKNFARMEREVRLMRLLGGGNGLVELLAVFEDAVCTYLVGTFLTREPSKIASSPK